jgi:dTDP-glucose 4,6-dehydratase/UDP-glucuronate decarboxylase
MRDAPAVVQTDLDLICERLGDEFAGLGGKTLLMTGGAGFLGYYMIQAIVHWNRNHNAARAISTVVLDNYFRGIPDWLEALRGEAHVTLLRHDIVDPLPADLPEAQAIVHAAGIASPVYYRKYPIQTMDANIDGLRHLLDHCVRRGQGGNPVEHLLFFSSSEIYGDPSAENIPTPETYRGNVSCTGPRACYDESKRYGETLCVNFAAVHGLPITVARPFNNYGPGLKITDGRVIPDFARDIFAGRDIVMKSDGSPMRTFCYATDAVVGYYKVLLRGRAGEPYNIGTDGPEITMLDLAERMVDIARDRFGYDGRVVSKAGEHAEYLEDNPNRRCPVIDKARTELDYEPVVGIDDGLERSLVWYSGHLDAEES